MDKLKSLNDLFIHELSDLYSAEKQLTKALPKLAKAASSPDLRAAFNEHLEQTQGQLARLEQVFSAIGAKPKRMVCKAMEGLVEEGKELIESRKESDPATLDAGLIASAQRVEHYEIAGYGTVLTYAKQLGHREAAGLLKETLDEEKTTDRNLSKLAVTSINQKSRKGEGESKWRPEGEVDNGRQERSSGGGSKGKASASSRTSSAAKGGSRSAGSASGRGSNARLGNLGNTGTGGVDRNVDNYRGENASEAGTSARETAPYERRGGR